jgi:hypothetical protein
MRCECLGSDSLTAASRERPPTRERPRRFTPRERLRSLRSRGMALSLRSSTATTRFTFCSRRTDLSLRSAASRERPPARERPRRFTPRERPRSLRSRGMALSLRSSAATTRFTFCSRRTDLSLRSAASRERPPARERPLLRERPRRCAPRERPRSPRSRGMELSSALVDRTSRRVSEATLAARANAVSAPFRRAKRRAGPRERSERALPRETKCARPF